MEPALIVTPEIVELDRIATVLSAVPGGSGAGLPQAERAAIFAFVEAPTWDNWRQIKNVTVTRRHKLRIAVMRHCSIGMYTLPSAAQVVSACDAAAKGTITP